MQKLVMLPTPNMLAVSNKIQNTRMVSHPSMFTVQIPMPHSSTKCMKLNMAQIHLLNSHWWARQEKALPSS